MPNIIIKIIMLKIIILKQELIFIVSHILLAKHKYLENLLI